MLSQCLRILCLDNHQDTCELIDLMLRQADGNYQITAVSAPDEAFRLIAGRKFDLYILDYQFPGISGVELCRRIRRTDKQTPVLFFTAMARPADRDAAMAAGANRYLVKPNDLDRLVPTVRELLVGSTVPETAAA